MANDFFARAHGAGEYIAIAGDLYEVKATGAETDGKYATFDAVVPPGGGPPPHIHHNEDEAFYVIEGEMTFITQGKEVVAGPGTAIHLPRNIAHNFQNRSDKPVRMLIQVFPAGCENYFRKAGYVVTDLNNIPNTLTPEAIGRLIEYAPEFGLEILVPAH
jgi:quercetin dioxygenase-like cupin family protein